MALVLFLTMGFLAKVHAQGSCARSHLDGSNKTAIAKKVLATSTAPFKEVWNRLTYMEVPETFSHPTYQKIKSKLGPTAGKAVENLLYYSANGFRKIYNSLSVRGVGLPMPAIKTQKDLLLENGTIPVEYKKTYWSDLNSWLNKFSLFTKVKTGSKKAYQAMILTGTIFFSIHTMGNVAEVAQSKPVFIQDKVSMSQTLPLRNDQIQILNETAPFPHTAIRIGSMVYSHGVNSLTQTPVDIYMKSHRLNQEGSLNGISSAEALNNSLIKKMGTLQRSVDSVVLNLDEQTVLNIRNQLLKQTNKEYRNTTFVNSCSTMVARVLDAQGIQISAMFLDASPSLIMSQLSLESLAGRDNGNGKPLVDGIYDLHYEGDASKKTVRNFLIRQLEAGVQMQIHTLPLRLAQRLQVNFENPTVDKFYLENPELKKGLEEIRISAEQDLSMIQEYDLYTLKKEVLLESGASKLELANLQKEFQPVFAEYIARYKEDLRNPSISFSEYHMTQFKIEFLEDLSK